MVRIRQSADGVEAGKEYGSWRVLGPVFRLGTPRWFVVAKCLCERVVVVRCEHLSRGSSSKCKWCQDAESRVGKKHGGCVNGGPERLYQTWRNMLGRCEMPCCTGFKVYGGRGIKVCQEWQDYTTFKAWSLANGYADHLTIDRIDNDGNYEPNNCQWITNSENASKAARDRRAKMNRKDPVAPDPVPMPPEA